MRSVGGAPDVTGLDLTEAEGLLIAAGFGLEKRVVEPFSGKIGSSGVGESRGGRGVLRVVRQRASADGVIEVTCVWQTAFLERTQSTEPGPL